MHGVVGDGDVLLDIMHKNYIWEKAHWFNIIFQYKKNTNCQETTHRVDLPKEVLAGE